MVPLKTKKFNVDKTDGRDAKFCVSAILDEHFEIDVRKFNVFRDANYLKPINEN